MVLGKRAACLRVVGDANPDPKIAALEAEFTELGNNIGMGAMGFVGSSMVIDCNIEVGYCHTGGMQMSVHAFCLSSRRAVARIHSDGQVEYRQTLTSLPRISAAKQSNGRTAHGWPGPRKLRLSTNPTPEALAELKLGGGLPGWDYLYRA